MNQWELFNSNTPARLPAKRLELRPYQLEAIESIYRYLRTQPGNPCAVLPTGAGKSPTMARLCADIVKHGCRGLVLAHRKELITQTASTVSRLEPGLPVGVYSAGLNRREASQKIIVAGIQSVYKIACDLDRFDIVAIDEAHLIPPDGEGMYRQFLHDAKLVNPNIRLVGFTATPFRLKSGSICSPDGILNDICYEIGVRQLIVEGFLSRLVSKTAVSRVDTAGLAMRGGEFVADAAERLFDVPEKIKTACDEIVSYAADRKSVLIFTSGKQHGAHVCEYLRAVTGERVEFVTGDTPDAERAQILADHKAGAFRWLANIDVLTTGYDAPNIDCVAILRATASPGLYYQIVGRGFRMSPETGKRDCLVLDFGGNILRHGPVDAIQIKEPSQRTAGEAGESPAKECPACHSTIAIGYGICPDCGYEWPVTTEPTHDHYASTAGVISGEVSEELLAVDSVAYAVHKKRGAADDSPRTLRVDYFCNGGFKSKSEWICVEHEGFAREKAAKWWALRSPDPMPATAARAVEIADGGGLAEPLSITIRSVSGERFDSIIDYELGPMPEPIEIPVSASYADDDLPF